MAIGFDNVHLQQQMIEKIQDQMRQEAVDEKDPAQPSDVDAFQKQMNGSEQDNQKLPATSATDSSEKVDNGLSVKPPGDQILDKMEGVAQDKPPPDPSASAVDPTDVAETLRMQVQVTKLGVVESELSATAGKASKDIDSLLKNQ